MRTIEDAIQPKWVDLPDGGRLECRVPTWEDHDRAITRAADATEGKQDTTDVTRELLRMVLVSAEGFQKKGSNGTPPAPAAVPEDTEGIVRSLTISDVRRVEREILYRVAESGEALGN